MKSHAVIKYLMLFTFILAVLFAISCSDSDNKKVFVPVRLFDTEDFRENLITVTKNSLRVKEKSIQLVSGTTLSITEDMKLTSFNAPRDFLQVFKTPPMNINEIKIDDVSIPYFENVSSIISSESSAWSIPPVKTLNGHQELKLNERTDVFLKSNIEYDNIMLAVDFLNLDSSSEVDIYLGNHLVGSITGNPSGKAVFKKRISIKPGSYQLKCELKSNSSKKNPEVIRITYGKWGQILIKTPKDLNLSAHRLEFTYNSIPRKNGRHSISAFLQRRGIEIQKEREEYLSRIITFPMTLGGKYPTSRDYRRAALFIPNMTPSKKMLLPEKPFLNFSLSVNDLKPDNHDSFIVEVTDLSNASNRLFKRFYTSTIRKNTWEDYRIDLEKFSNKEVSINFKFATDSISNNLKYVFLGEPIIASHSENTQNERPNIVLISLDTTRAERTSSQGYYRNTMPVFDKLASEGVLFTNARSQCNWTLPSHKSMLTGIHPLSFHHMAQEKLNIVALPKEVDLLSSFAKKSGYITSAFVENSFVAFQYGFYKDFDRYFGMNLNRHVKIDGELRLIKSAPWDEAHSFIENNKNSGPFFLFLHTYIPHSPYSSYGYDHLYNEESLDTDLPKDLFKKDLARKEWSADDVAHLNKVYDRGLNTTNDYVEEIYNTLKKNGLLDNTLLIVTSDHGELLGEHNYNGAHSGPWEETHRIPLAIRFPEKVSKGKVIKDRVELLDIAPTILDVLSINKPDYMKGTSLFNLMENRNYDSESYKLIGEFTDSRYSRYAAIYKDDLKFVLNDTKTEAYDLIKDPTEENAVDKNIIGEKEWNKLEIDAIYAFAQQTPGWKVLILENNENEFFRITTNFDHYRQDRIKRKLKLGRFDVYTNWPDLTSIKGPALIHLGVSEEEKDTFEIIRFNKNGNESHVSDICFLFWDNPLNSPLPPVSSDREFPYPSFKKGIPESLTEKYKIFVWRTENIFDKNFSLEGIEFDEDTLEQLKNLGYLN
jgi:arylsulfatase A-like enzyme